MEMEMMVMLLAIVGLKVRLAASHESLVLGNHGLLSQLSMLLIL